MYHVLDVPAQVTVGVDKKFLSAITNQKYEKQTLNS